MDNNVCSVRPYTTKDTKVFKIYSYILEKVCITAKGKKKSKGDKKGFVGCNVPIKLACGSSVGKFMIPQTEPLTLFILSQSR